MKSLTLAAALAVVATGALAQDVVRIGTEGAYPPYNFINDAGEVDGFEIEKFAVPLPAGAQPEPGGAQDQGDARGAALLHQSRGVRDPRHGLRDTGEESAVGGD